MNNAWCGVGLRMHVAHRRFNVIVARHVLQRKRVGVLPGLGQEGVAESVEPGVRMGLDSLPQIADLGFKHPRSERSGRVARMGEDGRILKPQSASHLERSRFAARGASIDPGIQTTSATSSAHAFAAFSAFSRVACASL
jgi:hypothetical protein